MRNKSAPLLFGGLILAGIIAWLFIHFSHQTVTPMDDSSTPLTLTSAAFANGELIPAKYSCDGENVSPPLAWSGNIPDQTQSFVLLMSDPDVPKSVRADGVFDHWVIWNIPANQREIHEGGPVPGEQGANTSGQHKYTGPCPPDREHRYFFALYAVDTRLSLAKGATKDDVLQALKGHDLASANLMGRYDRAR